MKTFVGDVMTRVVVTAEPGSSFKEVLTRMEEFRVSALPVLDESGRLAGIVSEDDLLLKEEYPAPEDRRGLTHRRERRKAAGRTAADVMTREVVTATAAMTLPEAARLMRDRRVKRLPVIDRDGRVLGVVSRADLLKVFLRSDEDIRAEIETDILDRTFWVDPHDVQVEVADGLVSLKGRVERKSLIPVLARWAEGVSGVIGVETAGLAYDFDDTHVRVPQPRMSDVMS